MVLKTIVDNLDENDIQLKDVISNKDRDIVLYLNGSSVFQLICLDERPDNNTGQWAFTRLNSSWGEYCPGPTCGREECIKKAMENYTVCIVSFDTWSKATTDAFNSQHISIE